MELVNSFPTPETTAPKFRCSIVDEHREDGYWIESFKFDRVRMHVGLRADSLTI